MIGWLLNDSLWGVGTGVGMKEGLCFDPGFLGGMASSVKTKILQ